MNSRTRTRAWLHAGAAAAVAACSIAVQAQPASTPVAPASPQADAASLSLRQVFDAAWARQPEAMALQARRDAARAQQSAATAWTPEPAALEISNRTDRLNSNQGAREFEVGVAVPLWLPGERGRSAALAEAEAAAIESRATAAQLVANSDWPSARSGGRRGLRASPPAVTRSSTNAPQSRLTPSGSSPLSTRAWMASTRGRKAAAAGPRPRAASMASAAKLFCSANSNADCDSMASG